MLEDRSTIIQKQEYAPSNLNCAVPVPPAANSAVWPDPLNHSGNVVLVHCVGPKTSESLWLSSTMTKSWDCDMVAVKRNRRHRSTSSMISFDRPVKPVSRSPLHVLVCGCPWGTTKQILTASLRIEVPRLLVSSESGSHIYLCSWSKDLDAIDCWSRRTNKVFVVQNAYIMWSEDYLHLEAKLRLIPIKTGWFRASTAYKNTKVTSDWSRIIQVSDGGIERETPILGPYRVTFEYSWQTNFASSPIMVGTRRPQAPSAMLHEECLHIFSVLFSYAHCHTAHTFSTHAQMTFLVENTPH